LVILFLCRRRPKFDISIDGTVAARDFMVFRRFVGGYLFALDFDGDGAVNPGTWHDWRINGDNPCASV
jgi:hypothetical protein